MYDLFDNLPDLNRCDQQLAQGAVVLAGFAEDYIATLLPELDHIVSQSPLRHMSTPGGHIMSVAMSNCGQLGWVSDAQGYRYQAMDPLLQKPWPAMPGAFLELAQQAADSAGFKNFVPDACLINRYEPGARLSLHQDKNERDAGAPIVSVSLGLPAIFLFGGIKRAQRPRRYRLQHGDVAVWGGPARFYYHGIAPLADNCHALLGRQRINLTFRKAA